MIIFCFYYVNVVEYIVVFLILPSSSVTYSDNFRGEVVIRVLLYLQNRKGMKPNLASVP